MSADIPLTVGLWHVRAPRLFRILPISMVTRAFATFGTGDEFAAPAFDAFAKLDALVDEGEPIVSTYQSGDDGPWILDILFMDLDENARARWLNAARDVCPTLPQFQFDALAERDWVAESQKALHPVRAGPFVVHGSHDRERLPPSAYRLQIDAGRAFGTAHHATTKGCLIALYGLAKKGPLGALLDVGTGSGILAIAGDRLGAEPVAASDIDPDAVAVAAYNVKLNRVRQPIATFLADGVHFSADTVIANILARPLIAMAPDIAACTRKHLVLSGMRTRDGRRVFAAYRARGFVRMRAIVVEDWLTLVLRRP